MGMGVGTLLIQVNVDNIVYTAIDVDFIIYVNDFIF
jgi:hypothetical protein